MWVGGELMDFSKGRIGRERERGGGGGFYGGGGFWGGGMMVMCDV